MRAKWLWCGLLLLAGCGSPMEQAAKKMIQAEHDGEPVTYVKVWEPKALSDSLAMMEAKQKEGKIDDRSNQAFIAYAMVASVRATHVTRIKYRALNKEGKNVLRDVLCFLKDGKAVLLEPLDTSRAFQYWLEDQALFQ